MAITPCSGINAPSVRFMQWDSSEIDPGGTRHLEASAFAYLKTLGTGCNSAFDFGTLTLDAASNQPFVASDTFVLNFVFPDINLSGFTLDNFRLSIPDGSGTALGLSGSFLQFAASGTWIQNPSFPSGADGSTEFPSSLPDFPNVTRIDGSPIINGFAASQASQWVYMRLFLDQDFPTGVAGACAASGTLRIRLTYDFYQ